MTPIDLFLYVFWAGLGLVVIGAIIAAMIAVVAFLAAAIAVYVENDS